MNEYPTAGEAVTQGVYVPPVDPAQQQRVEAERKMLATSLPIIEDVIDWFEQKMEWADSLQRIDVDAKVSPEAQIIAFQELQRLLNDKRAEFTTLYKAYKSKQQEAQDGNTESDDEAA